MAANSSHPRQPLQEFDAFASNYDEALNRGLSLTGERKEYYAESRVRWLRTRLEALGIAGLRTCVDYGCGTGTSAPFLVDTLNLEAYCGFDPSDESITLARLSHASPQMRFTSDLGSISPGSIDLVFCNGVFHHIATAERNGAFQQVCDLLKPSGIFAFWENNPWNPMVHFIMSRVEFDRNAKMLWPSEAVSRAKGAGLRRLDLSFLFIFPALLSFARNLEPWLSRLPLGGQYLLLLQKDA